MALRLRNNRQRGSVGLDIDDRFVAAVVVEGDVVTRAASIELAPGIVEEGEVRDVEQLARTLRDFFKAEGLPTAVRLGVSNQLISVRRIELPQIEDPGELDAAVRFQAADAIAMPLEDAVLDFQVTGQTVDESSGAVRLQVTVAAARREMVEKLALAAQKAGLRPQNIDLDAFALVRMYADVDGPEGGGPTRVYCHLSGVTNLAIASGAACVFTRSLSARWDTDAGDIASLLADEIRMSTDFYMGQPGVELPQELVLSGPGAHSDGLAAALGERTGMPTTVAEPLGRLSRTGDALLTAPERHTVAAGLAIGAAA